MFLNPNLFFLVQDNKIIVWDYLAHAQYELTEHEFFLLQKLDSLTADIDKQSILDLKSANLISDTPYLEVQWGWDVLSKIYMLGIQNVIPRVEKSKLDSVKNYLKGSQELSHVFRADVEPRERALINLPEPDLIQLKQVSFLDVLQQRMTSRVFHEQVISLDDLSTFLFVSFGYFHGSWKELISHGFEELAYRKSSPSAGGIHHAECYLLIYNVSELEAGVYKYCPEEHALEKINKMIDREELVSSLSGQFFAENIACGIFITARFNQLMKKYPHSEALRVAYIDAGALVQTSQLCSTALGMESFITGAFHDDSVKSMLTISQLEHAPLFFIGLGYGDRQPFPDTFK